DRVARAGLARALRGGEQWTELATTLRGSLEIAEPGTGTPILVELAHILDTNLDDAPGAIAAYRGVLAVDPANREALEALARLYDRAGQTQPAVEALEALLAQTTAAVPRG